MAQTSSVQCWTTHALDKVFVESERPPGASQEIALKAARNETEDAQVCIRMPAGVEATSASFEVPDLLGPGGACIDSQNVSAFWEWYTYVTHNPPGNTDPSTYLRQAPALFPDGFVEQPTVRILRGRTEPLWVSVRVPADAVPGQYRGTLRIHVADSKSTNSDFDVPITLAVWPFSLPHEGHLHHTEWFVPEVLANYYRVEPWSEAHWQWIAKVARDMARHRQDMILTPFTSLVRTTRWNDGRLTFDFSRLDRWVRTFRKEGITWIEGGHIAGRSGDWYSGFVASRFPVWDEAGRTIDSSRAAMHDEEFETILEAFLRAIYAHLKEKGWHERYVQHIADEPVRENEKSWCRLAGKLTEWLPGVRRIDAIMGEGFEGSIEMRVPQIQEITEPSKRVEPEELWSYVCLAPQGIYPNRFLDYASIRNRIIFWLSWTLGLRGFLHWGYSYWRTWGSVPTEIRVSPWTDATGASVYSQGTGAWALPAGDPFIVYPGEKTICSSLRWEVIRKGMEDFEYLYMLQHLAEKISDAALKERASRLLVRVRREIAPDPARHTQDAGLLLKIREEIGETIAEMTTHS